jgi:daunorubicin resistance ABC transporter ATP-binding subunit
MRSPSKSPAPPGGGGVIEARGLVKRYGEVVALAGLDLTVPEGTVLGLLGPNGAGKTTAVSILTTLLKPDAGTATVAGADLVGSPGEVRKRIGLSGQYAAVDEHLTGFENLDMIGRLYRLGAKRAKIRAHEPLERFSLEFAADRPVKTYSGGMRRRLDLAGALVAEAPVLFLDEPTTGLDPRSRTELWTVIRNLVNQGSTLLLTTQYMEEADQLADDIVVIDHGRKIAHGTADELKTMAGGERIEVSLQSGSSLEDARRVLARFSAGDPYTNELSVIAPVTGGAQTLTAALRSLDAEGIELADVGLRKPTLDDVFLFLTGHVAQTENGSTTSTDNDEENPPAPNRRARGTRRSKDMTTPTTPTMKAIVQDGYGAPLQVLELAEVDRPSVGDDDVLVRVRATSVNTPDWITVTGTPYVLRLKSGLRKPSTPVRGTDVAGVVEAVGKGVTDLQPGDEVFGSLWDSTVAASGAFAEFAVAPASQLRNKPAGLTFEEAAASVMSGLTALIAIRDVGRVGPGTRVLINGASGGVGTFAVQIAKALGAEVTGVCSTPNLELVRSLGADQVIDYTEEDYTRGQQRYDVILDNVMNHPPTATARALTPTGMLIPNSIGNTGGLFAGLPRMARATLMGRGSTDVQFATCVVNRENLDALGTLLESGDVNVVIDRTYALRDAADAVAHMLGHHARGKVVIAV